MFRFSKATLVKVIVFVLVSAVFTVGLALKIGNLQLFSHQYTLHAQFADASGVFKGDSVKLAGVDVGRVQHATIDNGHATVTFSLDKDVKLTTDSTVALRWRNVLGLRYLYVFPGSGQGHALANGDTIPLSHTEDAADLGQFLNEIGPILKAVDPDKANAFLEAMNTALSGNEVAVRALLDDGASLAQSLAGQDKQIQSLIGSSDTVVSTYADQRDAITRILHDLDHLGGRLDQMTGDVDSFITNFADVQTQLNGLLTTSKGNIDATLSELESVLGTLVANKSNLAATLCTLPAGLTPYAQTSSWGEWFNVNIVQIQLAAPIGQPLEVSQLSGQRPKVALPKAYTCPGSGAFNGSKSNKKGATEESAKSGFQGVSSFVNFVVGGARRG